METYSKTMVDTINNSQDCIEVALAIETLAYHNKNLLNLNLASDCNRNNVIRELLRKAIDNM